MVYDTVKYPKDVEIKLVGLKKASTVPAKYWFLSTFVGSSSTKTAADVYRRILVGLKVKEPGERYGQINFYYD